MRQLQRYMLPLACFAAIGAAISIFWPRRVEGQYSSPVRVMNTNAQPIPSRDRDNPAQQPYLAEGDCVIPAGSTDCSFDLPLSLQGSGKRLVIDHVSMRASQLSATSSPYVLEIVVSHNSGLHTYYFPINLMTSEGIFSSFVSSQSTMLFCDGNDPALIVGAERLGTTGISEIPVSISGHFVDIP
jgi:hypothetical protein